VGGGGWGGFNCSDEERYLRTVVLTLPWKKGTASVARVNKAKGRGNAEETPAHSQSKKKKTVLKTCSGKFGQCGGFMTPRISGKGGGLERKREKGSPAVGGFPQRSEVGTGLRERYWTSKKKVDIK